MKFKIKEMFDAERCHQLMEHGLETGLIRLSAGGAFRHKTTKSTQEKKTELYISSLCQHLQ